MEKFDQNSFPEEMPGSSLCYEQYAGLTNVPGTQADRKAEERLTKKYFKHTDISQQWSRANLLGQLQGSAFKTEEWRLDEKDDLISAKWRIRGNRMHHWLYMNQERFHEMDQGCTCILCGRSAQDVFHIMSCIAMGELGVLKRVKMVNTIDIEFAMY